LEGNHSCGAIIVSADQILLISDRPDRSLGLACRLERLCACRTIGLHEQTDVAETVTAVITDVDFRRSVEIDHLRRLLSNLRTSAAPIIAILRDNSHLETVQAAAVGATKIFPANVSFSDISAALAPAIQLPAAEAGSDESATPAQNLEQARRKFGNIFRAAERDEIVDRAEVDNATGFVMAAVTDGGIRQWLEIVWTYDDATYQHCMLVTGLAAEFAAGLRFAAGDSQRLIKGALLHDVGKAKIPLNILNKPGKLTSEELTVMRTHPEIGYDLLRSQGDYEPDLLEVVLRHHEMLDGSGYPGGLVGSQIKDLVRLVTICDIFGALIERRSYKAPMEPAGAFKILQDMEGKLEGALIRAFTPVAERSAAPHFA